MSAQPNYSNTFSSSRTSSSHSKKYAFPTKKILLTRESKERTANNNGNPFGVQIVGGKIPGSNLIGAFVSRIQPGGVVETIGEMREGNLYFNLFISKQKK